MEAVGYASRATSSSRSSSPGTIAGIAGALYTQFDGSITPDALWTTSGEALLMVIIGGTARSGADLGAAAFILLQSLVSAYTERWMLILGRTFILFVLFAPGGSWARCAGGWGSARDAAAAPGRRRALPRLRRARALDRVSLRVEPGERRAIIGPNGAGKTTLFNLITGQLAPSAGRILLRGRSPSRPAAARRRPPGIARSFQRTNLFPRLTVLENIGWPRCRTGAAATICSASVERRAVQLDARARGGRRRGLAGGSATRRGACPMASSASSRSASRWPPRPRLLLLDEPTAGMSPEETQRMMRMLEALPREVTLLIIEHDMDVVGSLADRITVIHYGQVLTEGTSPRSRPTRACTRSTWGARDAGLAVDGIHTYYGDSHMLQGVSLGVAPGEVVALLGRNGAGKTT